MMESQNKSVYILVISCIVLLLLLTPKSINAQEVDNQSEFDYGKNSDKGPTKWGSMKEEWSACSNGTMQSPIDLTLDKMEGIFSLERRVYRFNANATLINRGHDIQIKWLNNAGSMFINNTEYFLRYAHWHSPSEHTMNGVRYDLELHMVHTVKSTDSNMQNKIAVVGVLYTIGGPDPFLSKLQPNISSIIDKKNNEIGLGMVDPNEIIYSNPFNYRYMGSLTTPPCTEGVIWNINREVKTVSREQVNLFITEATDAFAVENARPVQPTNNRDIHICGPIITI